MAMIRVSPAVLVLVTLWASGTTRGATVAAESAGGSEPALRWLSTAIDTIHVESDPVCLMHGFVDPARLELRAEGDLLRRERDYGLDPTTGCIYLETPDRWLGRRLVARYVYFPFALERPYLRREPAIAVAEAPADSAIPTRRRSRAPPPLPGGSGLRVRGYKTFAVKLGSNQDATLNQSLDLDVAGEIAPGVELRALLSDRDLPLQATGNTETLDEIDKVMLEVRTRTLSATLGDYDIRAYAGDFLRYAKRLEGVKAEGVAEERGFVLAAAVAKGEFISLELPGVEGKQGPYVLTDAGGNDAITVIAGTETIWLDGQRLARGESQDYTIDYGRGEVSFTPGRLITQDSRITVDFEFSTEAFERNFYVGGARSAFLDGALRIGASVVSELDDEGSPIVALSDAERVALESAGDSTQTITANAGVDVGEGNGDYFQLPLGGDAFRYQYAGLNDGNFDVNFVEVGTGAGDYEDSLTTSGETVYRYVGVGAGAFQPFRRLAAPTAHRLADFTATYGFGDVWSIDSELAVSGLDLNTLSSLDDSDNGGTAGRLRLALKPHAAGPELSAGYRDVSSTFRALGRIRPADYDYDWNAPVGAFDNGERRRDLGLDWRLPGRWLVGGELADTRSSLFDGERRRLWTTLERRVRLRFNLLRTTGDARPAPSDTSRVAATDRQRALESAELSTTWWRLTPQLRFQREERREEQSDRTRSGNLFTRYGATTGLSLWRGALVTVGYDRRIDETLATGTPWRDQRRAHEQSYRLEVPRWQSVSVTGSFIRRTTETVATGAEQVADLVQIDLVSSAHGGGLENEVHYDATTTDVASAGRELVFVGEGLGAYDAFGRFVGTGGDYDLRRTDEQTSDLRTRLRITTRTEFRPRRIWRGAAEGWLRYLRWTGFETTLFVDELSRLPLASPSLFLDPSSYQRPDATFLGTFRLRQDLDLWEQNRVLSLRCRYEQSDQADTRTAGIFEDRGERRTSLRLRSSPRTALSIEWTGQVGNRFEEEQVIDSGATDRIDLRRTENRVQFTLRPRRTLRLGLTLLRRHERDRPTAAEIEVVEWSPSVTVQGRRLRLDGRFRRVDETRRGVFPSGSLVSALLGSRTEYNATVDYRATDHVSLSGGLDGSGRPDQDFIHTARVELRAYF